MIQLGQRRSERVLVDLPVVVQGNSPDRQPFREETFTVTVSAHGALLMMATRVALGQELVLTNGTNEERETRVSYVGPAHAGLAQVGIEFVRPAPEFWPVNSPSSDGKSS
jgi:hypothetical protein